MTPIVLEGDVQPFNKETRGRIAACAALGLHYWSGHPTAGCLWAIDENQNAYVVRWYRSANQVALQKKGTPRRVRDGSSGYPRWIEEAPMYDDGERIDL